MKKKLLICASVLASALVSCDSFLDREPLDKISSEAYFKTAKDLELYVNQFYTVFPAFGGFGIGYLATDGNSDNMVTEDYNTQLAGYTTVPGNASDAGWNWGEIRSINYMLGNLGHMETAFDQNKQFIGEAYFFRSYYYFSLLKKFGDLPWVNEAYDTDSKELFNPRVARNVIVDSMLVDLDKAIEYIPEKGKVDAGRLSKEAALLFKSRVALYEASWEKYHQGTKFGVEGSDYNAYYRVAADAAKQVMDMGTYSLFTTGDPNTSYYNLFNKTEFQDNPEVILARTYSLLLGLTHRAQNYLIYRGSRTGLSKSLVNDYLCLDGKPVAAHPEHSDKNLTDEIKDRDPRLAQTIWCPGDLRYGVGEEPLYFELPFLNLTGEQHCTTGYQLKKGSDPYCVDTENAETGVIVFRYAEALLNYAEAANEYYGPDHKDVLGDQEISPYIVLRKIRECAGIEPGEDGTYGIENNMSQADMTEAIRLERRLDLAFEGHRFFDVRRWMIAEDTDNRMMHGFEITRNGEQKTGRIIDTRQHTFRKAMYFYPIPYKETVKSPDLLQNPYYE